MTAVSPEQRDPATLDSITLVFLGVCDERALQHELEEAGFGGFSEHARVGWLRSIDRRAGPNAQLFKILRVVDSLTFVTVIVRDLDQKVSWDDIVRAREVTMAHLSKRGAP